jgi:GNAT superfamily N-acetyltransferase
MRHSSLFSLTLSRVFPMSDNAALFEKEIRNYVRWLRVLDLMSKSRPAGMSVWYKGAVFEVYTRAGTPGSRLRGRNALCLANIEVKKEYQGQGFFAMLVERLARQPQLSFDGLEVESVMNEGLCKWLRRSGFEPMYSMPGRGDLGASFGIGFPDARQTLQ